VPCVDPVHCETGGVGGLLRSQHRTAEQPAQWRKETATRGLSTTLSVTLPQWEKTLCAEECRLAHPATRRRGLAGGHRKADRERRQQVFATLSCVGQSHWKRPELI